MYIRSYRDIRHDCICKPVCTSRYAMSCEPMQILLLSALFDQVLEIRIALLPAFSTVWRARFFRKLASEYEEWQEIRKSLVDWWRFAVELRLRTSRWKCKSRATSATDCYICRSHNARYRVYIIRCIMHGACVAARYCGGNGVAENGKAAAVVHTTSASLLSLLTVVALRFRSVCAVTQLLPR